MRNLRGPNYPDMPQLPSLIEGYSKPAYCSGCGSPFPWQASGIENLKAVLQEAGLTAEDRDELDSVLPDGVRDTPKSDSAALRMKRVLSKVGKPLYDVALKVATDVASETAKKTLGLKAPSSTTKISGMFTQPPPTPAATGTWST